MSLLRKTRFMDAFIDLNAFRERGFHAWLFCPPMLFQSMDLWWGDQGKRKKPHEGLDLLLYGDKQGRTHNLQSGTKVPALYDGEVIRIINDFLGKTIILRHTWLSDSEGVLCTLFGHTDPEEHVCEGKTVLEGDVIASLADPSCAASGVQAHLHVSVGLLRTSVSYTYLDWTTMGDPATMRWMDPLQIPGWHYQVRECSELF